MTDNISDILGKITGFSKIPSFLRPNLGCSAILGRTVRGGPFTS